MVFDYLITGDEAWVHFLSPSGKLIWGLKHAKRPSIAKQTRLVKRVLYVIFFRNSGPLMQIAVSKDGVCLVDSIRMWF